MGSSKNSENDDKQAAAKKQSDKKNIFELFQHSYKSSLINHDGDKAQKQTTSKPKKLLSNIGSFFNHFQYSINEQKRNQKIHEVISDSSRLSNEFILLLFCSCAIATTGLMQNSAAVIIGAMIIAPLMMPILAFSLGAIWGDKKLILQSVLTLFVGTICAIGLSSLITILLPGVELNEQITARINPGLFDIVVALLSGVVGAYAYANPKISNSVSGVAIAVALMPPLCSVGICLGTGHFQSAMGALLLFTTNLVGISLAASLIFWLNKVHPIGSDNETRSRAVQNLVISFVLLILISIPLAYMTQKTYAVKKVQTEIRQALNKNFPTVEVENFRLQIFPDRSDLRLHLSAWQSFPIASNASPVDTEETVTAYLVETIPNLLQTKNIQEVTLYLSFSSGSTRRITEINNVE